MLFYVIIIARHDFQKILQRTKKILLPVQPHIKFEIADICANESIRTKIPNTTSMALKYVPKKPNVECKHPNALATTEKKIFLKNVKFC